MKQNIIKSNNKNSVTFKLQFEDKEEFEDFLKNLGVRRVDKVLKVSPDLHAYLESKCQMTHYKDNNTMLWNYFNIPVEIDWNLTDYNYRFEEK